MVIQWSTMYLYPSYLFFECFYIAPIFMRCFIWIPRFMGTSTLVCVGHPRVILSGSNPPRHGTCWLKSIWIRFTHMLCPTLILLHWASFGVTRQEPCSQRILTTLSLPRHSLFGFDITHSRGQRERREFHSVCQTWLYKKNPTSAFQNSTEKETVADFGNGSCGENMSFAIGKLTCIFEVICDRIPAIRGSFQCE